MGIQEVLKFLPVVVAPFVLIIFSMVSAFVFRFGLPKTGIHFDYMVFAIVVIIALVLGGAI